MRRRQAQVRQVEAISMQEALSACNIADAYSLQGMAAVASFSMGCLMGGRRPRTLTAVKLKDASRSKKKSMMIYRVRVQQRIILMSMVIFRSMP